MEFDIIKRKFVVHRAPSLALISMFIVGVLICFLCSVLSRMSNNRGLTTALNPTPRSESSTTLFKKSTIRPSVLDAPIFEKTGSYDISPQEFNVNIFSDIETHENLKEFFVDLARYIDPEQATYNFLESGLDTEENKRQALATAALLYPEKNRRYVAESKVLALTHLEYSQLVGFDECRTVLEQCIQEIEIANASVRIAWMMDILEMAKICGRIDLTGLIGIRDNLSGGSVRAQLSLAIQSLAESGEQ